MTSTHGRVEFQDVGSAEVRDGRLASGVVRNRTDRNPVVLDVASVWFMLSSAVVLLTLRDVSGRVGLALPDLVLTISAVLVGLAGLQAFRRRTYWFCQTVPIAIGLINFAGFMAGGWSITIFAVYFPAGLAAVIFTRRSAFQS